MPVYSLEDIKKHARFFGRTIPNGDCTVEFFNWTCSGFEVRFTGKKLAAEMVSIPARAPMTQEVIYEYPWVAVLVDGSEEFSQRFELAEQEKWYTLFESETAGTHTVRVVKLSENARGKTGLKSIGTDGALEKVPAYEPSLRLEFVGDSITCGYGNEAGNRDAPFKTGEENGWITYASLAARELGAEFSCVCVSGISVSHGMRQRFPLPMMLPAMEDVYKYTDQLYDTVSGNNGEKEVWNFAGNPVDAVIINLGTNDVNAIKLAGLEEKDLEEKFFIERYRKFIEQIRSLNGSKPHIFCTLGPLDYYLYDSIKEAVREYKEQTGDERVTCYKFGGVNLFTEGFGAVGHPSAKTHRRMADELKALLSKHLSV